MLRLYSARCSGVRICPSCGKGGSADVSVAGPAAEGVDSGRCGFGWLSFGGAGNGPGGGTSIALSNFAGGVSGGGGIRGGVGFPDGASGSVTCGGGAGGAADAFFRQNGVQPVPHSRTNKMNKTINLAPLRCMDFNYASIPRDANARRRRRGRRKMKVLPFPGSLFTSIVPP